MLENSWHRKSIQGIKDARKPGSVKSDKLKASEIAELVRYIMDMAYDEQDYPNIEGKTHVAFIADPVKRREQSEFTRNLLVGLNRYIERYEDVSVLAFLISPEVTPGRTLTPARVYKNNMEVILPRLFMARRDLSYFAEQFAEDLAPQLVYYLSDISWRADLVDPYRIPAVTARLSYDSDGVDEKDDSNSVDEKDNQDVSYEFQLQTRHNTKETENIVSRPVSCSSSVTAPSTPHRRSTSTSFSSVHNSSLLAADNFDPTNKSAFYQFPAPGSRNSFINCPVKMPSTSSAKRGRPIPHNGKIFIEVFEGGKTAIVEAICIIEDDQPKFYRLSDLIKAD